MNSVHDMGGCQGFGPVVPEPGEPTFHHDWERRVFGITVAMGAARLWNLDQSRSARESLPPAQYLASSYYEIWLAALTKLMDERGLLGPNPAAVPKLLTADRVAGMLRNRLAAQRDPVTAARFRVGDAVRTRNLHPATHTRLPRYCRDKPGTVAIVHGVHVFPDTHAIGEGERPQWLYGVRFEARDLWGEHTTASAVYVDCFEPYLEPR